MPIYMRRFYFAQSTTIEMLGNAKVWRAQFPGKDKIIFEISFSKTEWTDQFTYDGTIAKRKSYFYLSDQLVKEFDQTKVGTSDNGKYIIQNLINRKSGEKTLKVYEIVELTSSEMKLKDLSTYDIIFIRQFKTEVLLGEVFSPLLQSFQITFR